MLVEGQIVGGVVQGPGGTLLEEFLYDDRGEPRRLAFADYLMPTVREAHDRGRHFEDAPSPLNPDGSQRRGEERRGRLCDCGAIDDAIGGPGRSGSFQSRRDCVLAAAAASGELMFAGRQRLIWAIQRCTAE